jgi:hypothetical protein
MSNKINEILTSDGEVKAAGSAGGNAAEAGQPGPSTPAADPNAVCEWRLRATGWEYDLYDACGDKPLKGMLTTQKRCHRCGKPIRFKEPTR